MDDIYMDYIYDTYLMVAGYEIYSKSTIARMVLVAFTF